MVFVDISGFTKMSERLARHGKVGAEEVTEVLGAVFAKLLAVAYGEDGSLLKFGGDALLLWFSGVGHAARAASAANAMRTTLRSVGRLDTMAGKVVLRMSVGVNSGSFHFFLVGDSHRELVVTGPAASQTVTMESTARAGEILVSRDTAAVLPAETIGRSKGEGLLLKRGPSTLAFDRDDKKVPLSSLDVTLCIPTALRDHLLSGFAEPEHRTATVAFVHFDGVDDRVMSRGADVLAAELHELVSCVQAAAETNGVTFLGTDIDRDGGKIILTGGAPNALGDDEGRMLLTLRAVIDAETALPVRIGVNRGPVFAGDIGPAYRRTYTVMGDAVNLAARVMSMAVPGQILSTGPVLDASSVAFNALPLEPFMVKGKKHPVHAFMVGHSTGSKPETVSREFPLVGRDEEMEAFRRALLELRGGHGSVLEVVGNAGMGKTRLLSEFRAEAPDLPHLVTGCELYESSAPYLPVRRLLRLLLGTGAATHASDVARRLEEDVGHRAPELLPWLPLLAIVADVEVPMTREVEDLGDEFRRAKLDEVTADYLSRVITEPTLVVVEDAHWMDGGSVDLLRSVAKGIAHLPWLVCVSRRDEETGFVLPEAERCVSLALTPLADEALTDLIDIAMADAPLHMHEVDELSARSGGNPLFLQELLRAARSVGSVAGLPDSIEGMITADIDRLPSADRRLLRYASVLGMSFDRALLERILQEEEIEFEPDAWQRLTQFVDEEGGASYRFRHALMRDAAYEGLPFRTRRRLHAAVASCLEAEVADTDEIGDILSLHFSLAGEHEKTWSYARMAARRAEGKFADVEAATLYRRAIEAGRRLTGIEAPDLEAAFEALAEAWWRAGDYDRAVDANAAARKLAKGEPVVEARLIYRRSCMAEPQGKYAEALRWASKGRKILEGMNAPEAASLRAQLSAWCAAVVLAQGHYAAAIEQGKRAADEARIAGNLDALARAYNAIDLAGFFGDRFSGGEFWRQALEVSEQLGDLRLQVIILSNLGIADFYAGRWSGAITLYERAAEVSVTIGDLVGEHQARGNVAELLSNRGSYEEAAAILREAVRVLTAIGYREFRAFCLMVLGQTLARMGRHDEALDALGDARSVYADIRAPDGVLDCDARIAECFVLRGDGSSALDLASDALARAGSAEGGAAQSILERVRGYALEQMGRSDDARAAFDASLMLARARGGMQFDVALALDAIIRLSEIGGGPAPAGFEEERAELLEHLGVERIAEIPLGAIAAGTGS
jgi:class 3 adenylate cyclase/tetratricopeptide (TPR) repeat protein